MKETTVKTAPVAIAAAAAVGLAMAMAPDVAFATEPGAGSAGSGLLSWISGIFASAQGIILAVYYGLVIIIGGYALVNIVKELLGAIGKANEGQRPQFNEHVKAMIVILIICVLAGLAPTILGLTMDYFGSTADIGLSTVI